LRHCARAVSSQSCGPPGWAPARPYESCLVATDDVGSGHKWRLIDDAPWPRCDVVLKTGAEDLFAANRRGED
jgi:hypothetical protein